MSNYCRSIFDFIKEQETAYRLPIRINDSWSWSMKEHLQTTENYTNAQLNNGKTDYTPVKNITLPILNLQHRTEDIDIKDVQIYVNDKEKYHLSLLVKKYHDDVFVVENDIDMFFDDLNVSRIDFGAGLSKQLNKPCPEVVPLQSIAFCSQRDLLAAPFGLLHEYSPDQLFDMEAKGWGNTKNGATHTVDQLITLWRNEDTPTDGIKVYEVHGNLPKNYSDSTYTKQDYTPQIFIVAFYTPKDGKEREGVILYTADEPELPFKLIKRDKIYGRAIGRGGGEEIFEDQVWTNYDMIRVQNMLEAASVTILKSTDPTIAGKHPGGLKHMKNLEIIDLAANTDISQIDTVPRSIQLFENHLSMWDAHAKEVGGAQDPLQGAEATSGTPFAAIQAQIQQGMGIHDYRRGQFARHLEEIYNDWIIPHIEKEICNGFTFLSELSLEEMQFVSERMAINEWNDYSVNKVLNGETIQEGEKEQYIQKIQEDFKKGGNKKFLEVLKGEFKNTPLAVKVSISGKSKDLGKATDALVNIFRFAFSNPQGFAATMQIPGMSSAFNQILQFSGISPVDFAGIEKLSQQPQQPQQNQQPQPSPLQLPTQAQVNG